MKQPYKVMKIKSKTKEQRRIAELEFLLVRILTVETNLVDKQYEKAFKGVISIAKEGFK